MNVVAEKGNEVVLAIINPPEMKSQEPPQSVAVAMKNADSIIRVTDGSDANSPLQEHTIGKGQKGSITQQIMDVYFNTVRGKVAKYDDWLTYVYD